MTRPSPTDPLKAFEGPGVRSVAQREFQRLLHELEVYQADVELQSEVIERAQRDLEEANERYFDLYELAPVGYATLDAEGRIVMANLMLSKLLGIERRRLVDTLLAQFMPTSDRSRFVRYHAEVLADSPNGQSFEVTLRRSDGRSVPVMLEATPYVARERSLRVAVIDLTRLRQAEARLREREASLRAVFDTVADGIVTVDAEGRIGSCNTAAARLFGATTESLASRAVNQLLPDFSKFAGLGRVELRAERLDGGSFPAEVTVSVLDGSDEARLVCVITDISSRRRREAELEEALTRFQQIAEHIEDAIYVVDADTKKTLYVSPAFEAIYGRSAADANLEPWPRLAWIHEEDREDVAAAANELERTGTLDHEYRIVRPDGSVRTVRSRAFLIRERNRLTGITHDLTEELALQAELRQAQRLEAIGTLASGVAHDFNNLLMGVGGCAQLALRRLDPEHDAYGYLRRAVDAILRGANLTRQILRFSDTRRATNEPVELDGIVAGARDLIHSLVGEQITLSVVVGAPGLLIAADPGDVEQILLNLASNARDAMPDGGGLVLRTEAYQGGMVALSVRDTGTGMSEETKRRVFEPFFTTKEIGAGTGLGLSTVFAVVRRMGGTVTIDSALGEGTTFTLYLPVVVPTPSSQEHPTEDLARGEGQTILVVDDDPLVRMTVETHVETLGYRALTASSVTEALKIYSERSRPIHVVLTDIMMPGLLGSDLARLLEKSAPDVAVIYMSAHPWQELVRQGQLTANSRLLAKPFDARDLGAALHQALKDRPLSTPPTPLRVFVVDDDVDVVDALRDLLELEGHVVKASRRTDEALAAIPEFVPDVVLCDLNIEDSTSGITLVSKLAGDPRVAKTAFLAVTGMVAGDSRRAALAAGFQEVLVKPLDFRKLSRLLQSHLKG